MISIIDGFKTLCQLLEIEYYGWLAPIISFYEQALPFYNQGLGWLVPAIVVIAITVGFVRIKGTSASRFKEKTKKVA